MRDLFEFVQGVFEILLSAPAETGKILFEVRSWEYEVHERSHSMTLRAVTCINNVWWRTLEGYNWKSHTQYLRYWTVEISIRVDRECCVEKSMHSIARAGSGNWIRSRIFSQHKLIRNRLGNRFSLSSYDIKISGNEGSRRIEASCSSSLTLRCWEQYANKRASGTFFVMKTS